MKQDVYQIVTDRILAELDKGTIPWKKPWCGMAVKWNGRKTHTEDETRICAVSRSTGKPYSLLNQFLLGKPGEWATFDQIQAAGGKVKKGEKSSICVFWKFLSVERKDENGNPVCDPKTGEVLYQDVPYLRYYNVFHVESQTDLKPRHGTTVTETVVVVDDPGTPEVDAEWAAVEDADAAVRAYMEKNGVKITEEPGSDRAFYRPSTDSITVPCRAQFRDRGEFYSTLFHEVTHSTGTPDRLNRHGASDQFSFGSESYSKEELVAEIGAATLNSIFEIETSGSFKNSAAYIAGWSKKLREDRKMIVSAASRAEKAVEYILN